MKKMVMIMEVHDEGSKQRIMTTAANFPGITSINMDPRDGKLTVTGEFDLMRIYNKLKRRWRCAEMVSFGPSEPTTATATATAETELTTATATAEIERARLEAYRENHSCYFPMHHYSNVGEHHHYHGCTIS